MLKLFEVVPDCDMSLSEVWEDHISIWGFPKIVVPPNHPFLIGFSILNHPFWGTPIFENTQIPVYCILLNFISSVLRSFS